MLLNTDMHRDDMSQVRTEMGFHGDAALRFRALGEANRHGLLARINDWRTIIKNTGSSDLSSVFHRNAALNHSQQIAIQKTDPPMTINTTMSQFYHAQPT